MHQTRLFGHVANDQNGPSTTESSKTKKTLHHLHEETLFDDLTGSRKIKIGTRFSEGKPHVLVIYTGGTIGMKPDLNGSLAPSPGFFTEYLKNMEELQVGSNSMPKVSIMEFDPILDSSCMGPEDWVHIAEVIEENYLQYDSFVVCMGTDTMAYTASALSFMFQNLGKTVIFTGAQIPLSKAYNDARRNLIVSLIMAGLKEINEVCLFFNDKLMRGCRASKVNSFGLDAFDSPNFPPLAQIGVNIRERRGLLLPPPKYPFRVHKDMDANVVVVKLVPGFSDEALLAMVRNCTKLKAIVLEMYGTGNMPSKRKEFLDFIAETKKQGILVVASTQCRKGSAVLDMYAVGRELLNHGVVCAGDMTAEAVATKLAYLFGRFDGDPALVAEALPQDLRGEISPASYYTTSLFSKAEEPGRLLL